ncbi:MAG: carboxypeptidase-like regulatory domain-containing protein, partial [Bacteroidota bacterium]
MEKKFHIKFSKIAYLFLMLFFSSQFLIAQTGSVKGKVTDENGGGLPGVHIVIEGTSIGASSDLNGAYLLDNVPVGNQNLKVSFIGYKSISKSVNVVEGKTTDLSFTLSKDALGLEEIMVTSTRRSINVQRTPASISAISGNQLEVQGKVDVTQFIDAVPGVTSVSNGSNNRIIFRNIATSTQEAGSAVSATYFDDFPISNPGGGIPTIRMVDMDRVEVLKGPQGTLFGRSAMSGIVRYIPNKPNTDKIAGGLNTYLSSTTDGGLNFGGHAYLNLPITDKMAIRAVGYGFNNSGFIDNVELNVPDFNDEKIYGGRFAFHWQPTDKFSVGATYLKENYQGSYAWVTSTHDPSDPYAHNPINVKDRTRIDGTKQENSPAYDF